MLQHKSFYVKELSSADGYICVVYGVASPQFTFMNDLSSVETQSPISYGVPGIFKFFNSFIDAILLLYKTCAIPYKTRQGLKENFPAPENQLQLHSNVYPYLKVFSASLLLH